MSRTLNSEQDGYLFPHRVGEHARLPFVCLIEFIAEAVASLCGSHHVITIKDLSITKPLVLADGRPRQIFVEVERLPDNVTYQLVIYSYPLLPDLTWLPRRIVIACAQAIVANTARLPNTLSIDTNLPLSFTAEQAYEIFAHESVHYGPLFQGLGTFYASDHSAYCVSLQARQETMPSPETKSFYNVALLDLACQSLAYILQGQPGRLPIRCDEIAIFTQPGNPQSSGYAFSALSMERTTAFDVTLTDQRGNVLAILQGIQLQSRVSKA